METQESWFQNVYHVPRIPAKRKSVPKTKVKTSSLEMDNLIRNSPRKLLCENLITNTTVRASMLRKKAKKTLG